MHALILLFTSGLCLTSASSGHVLLLVPFGSQSHKNLFSPLAYAIGTKGYQVTLISMFPAMDELPNVKEIVATELTPLFSMIRYYTVLVGIEGLTYHVAQGLTNTTYYMCIKFFESQRVQDWIRKKTKPFDVVIIDAILTDCLYPLGHLIGRSVVAYNTATIAPWIAKFTGSPLPYSIVPCPLRLYHDKMTFWQRLNNLYEFQVLEFTQNNFYYPPLDALVQKYFPGALTIRDAYKKMSFAFVNTDPVLITPKPYTPNVVNIGGMHCRPGKSLPKDLEDFATESAKDGGFIIFSLGSIFKDSMLNEHKKQNFLTALSKLKYKVIWKIDAEFQNVPKNVKVVKWFPQQDLLAHSNCRAFITHGGLLSLQEAVYHQVPLVVIPLFVDQPSNAARVEELGIGVYIDWNNFTVQEVVDAVEKVTSPQVVSTVKKYSEIFKDRPHSPSEIAVYMIEMLIKYRDNNPFINSSAKFMSTIEYFMLDVVLVLFLALILFIWMCLKIIKIIYFNIKTLNKNKYN